MILHTDLSAPSRTPDGAGTSTLAALHLMAELFVEKFGAPSIEGQDYGAVGAPVAVSLVVGVLSGVPVGGSMTLAARS